VASGVSPRHRVVASLATQSSGPAQMEQSSTHGIQFIAGNLALDFVNTVGERAGDRREYLSNATEFNRWARTAGLLRGGARVRPTREYLERVRTVREELHRLFESLAFGAPVSARSIASLNARIASIAPKRQLKCENNTVAWVWNSSANDPDRVLGPVLMSAAELLESGLFRRVRQCEGDRCGWLFLDRSPAGHRRWCSMADCGNRAKARRYYRDHVASGRGTVSDANAGA
jgi:predicted RNA-binding Zn ribbon-like protein